MTPPIGHGDRPLIEGDFAFVCVCFEWVGRDDVLDTCRGGQKRPVGPTVAGGGAHLVRQGPVGVVAVAVAHVGHVIHAVGRNGHCIAVEAAVASGFLCIKTVSAGIEKGKH